MCWKSNLAVYSETSPSPLTSEIARKLRVFYNLDLTPYRLTLTLRSTVRTSAYMAHLIKSLGRKDPAPQERPASFCATMRLLASRLGRQQRCEELRWEGRINGRMCRDPLSRFPDLGVLEARAKALEYKTKIARQNPVGQREAERAALRAEKRFAQLIDEY